MRQSYPPGTRVSLVNLHRHCENSAFWLARVDGYLRANGFRLVAQTADAEVVIFSTCALTDEIMTAMEQALLACASGKSPPQVVVLGCLAAFPERLARLEAAGLRDPIGLPVSELHRLEEWFHGEIPWDSVESHGLVAFDQYQPFVGPSDVYVQIAQGCANRCSYCNIRNAKGSTRSRGAEKIADETEALCSKGSREITLLADDCGSYGLDLGSNIAELVTTIVARSPQVRLKIYTIFPALLLRYWPDLRPHVLAGNVTYICLPVQSGSPRVLELMRRSLDLSDLRAMIEDIREHAPAVQLYTHFIVGFPSETDADFERSLALAPLFDAALFIAYGENARTQAASLEPRCTTAETTRRLEAVRLAIKAGRLAPRCAVVG